MLNLKTDWAKRGSRATPKTDFQQPKPWKNPFSTVAFEKAGKPMSLVWESVRFGKVRRMYYYCKKCFVYNDAYRAVVGRMSYLVKFGLKIPNADPHKWQEHFSQIRKMAEDAEHDSGHKPSFEYRNNFGMLEMTAHVSEYFFNAWNAVAAQDAMHLAHAHENAETHPYHGFEHTYNSENTFHFESHGRDESGSGHGHNYSHGEHHHAHHEHHSHGHHGHESHSSHSHSSHDSFSSWFFMSFWHTAGMNPYAVCIANHKAHEIHAGHGHSSHSLGAHGTHGHSHHHEGSHSSHNGNSHDSLTHSDRSHQEAHPGYHSHLHGTHSLGHGSYHSNSHLAMTSEPHPVLLSQFASMMLANDAPAASFFMEAHAPARSSWQGVGPRRGFSGYFSEHKRAYHISLNLRQMQIGRIVVGAEALPD